MHDIGIEPTVAAIIAKTGSTRTYGRSPGGIFATHLATDAAFGNRHGIGRSIENIPHIDGTVLEHHGAPIVLEE